MAEKDFGVKRINLIGDSGTPTITSPNNLNINAVTVAISTDISIGGQVSSNLKIGDAYSVGIGTTNPTSKLWVGGDGFFVGVITASKFSGQLDAASGLAQKVGFATTSTSVIGGIASVSQLSVSGFSTVGVLTATKIGIGTTNPTSELVVIGNSNISGIVTIGVGNSAVVISAGIITSSGVGTVTYFGNLTGTASTASFATTAFNLDSNASANIRVGFATTATNLAGGTQGSLPYQNSSGITSFLDGALDNNKVLLYNSVTGKPYWGDVSSGSGSFGGITVIDESTTTLSNIITLNILGNNISATSGGTGIASIRVNDNLVGTSLSISGISTLGITSVSQLYVTGVGTFGTGLDVLNSLSITSLQPGDNLFEIYNAAQNVVVAVTTTGSLGIGTTNPTSKLDVIGNAKISGITTVSVGNTGVVINGIAGIITSSNPGVTTVVYYGDGSKLTGIQAASATNVVLNADETSTTTSLVFSQTANQDPTSSLKSNPKLIFNAATSSLGIGTETPTSKLWVGGDGYFVGVVTSSGFYVDGQVVGSDGVSGGPLVGTALSISGISTFGTADNGVLIRTVNGVGVVTSSNPGVTSVTYYGDGSNLTGVTGTKIVTQGILSVPVYPTFANNVGVTSLGIATTNFVYVPSTGRVGLGSTNPSFTLDINGDLRIRSENKLRFGGALDSSKFYIQYNSASNSLDFVAQ